VDKKMPKEIVFFHFEPFTLLLFGRKESSLIHACSCKNFLVEFTIPVRVGKVPFQLPLQRDSRQAKKAAEERDVTKTVRVL
jgi:hypothetical protein